MQTGVANGAGCPCGNRHCEEEALPERCRYQRWPEVTRGQAETYRPQENPAMPSSELATVRKVLLPGCQPALAGFDSDGRMLVAVPVKPRTTIARWMMNRRVSAAERLRVEQAVPQGE